MNDKQLQEAFEKWKEKVRLFPNRAYQINTVKTMDNQTLNKIKDEFAEIGYTAGAEYGYKEGKRDTLDVILVKVRSMKKHGAIDVYPESIFALEAVEVFLLENKLFPENIDTELEKARK